MRKPPKFLPGQPVTLHFSPASGADYTEDAVIVENCDATCKPLTDMWMVRLGTGFTFGFSGKAISARTAA